MRTNQAIRQDPEADCGAGWAASLCFTSYGRNVKFRSNDVAVLDRIMPLLPPGWQAIVEQSVDLVFSLWIDCEQEHRLYCGKRLIRQCADVDWLLLVLESELQVDIAEHARDRVFIHAGVVGWKGSALLLPGRSMAGKSTLVEALVRAGAEYYSDEYAVIDQCGQVHPYARPLSLRQPKGTALGLSRRCTAEELGGARGDSPLPIKLVMVTQYREGARWAPRPLASSQAFVELMNNTVPATSYPERALQTVGELAVSARVLKSWRGEARETAQALLCEMEKVHSL
jgi:hypothetical protein